MPKQEVPVQTLNDFLPSGCLEDVLHLLNLYQVQLTIKRERTTLLGDYRFASRGRAHRISVNGNLNKFSFLITLLHELAHLLSFEKYGTRIQPHGQEWKKEYSTILTSFLAKDIFPEDIKQALAQTIKNPAASSCGDDNLLRILHRYDNKPEGTLLVEQITSGGLFSIKGGRVFMKGEKIRTRYKCREVGTGKWYLFHGVYQVSVVEKSF